MSHSPRYGRPRGSSRGHRDELAHSESTTYSSRGRDRDSLHSRGRDHSGSDGSPPGQGISGLYVHPRRRATPPGAQPPEDPVYTTSPTGIQWAVYKESGYAMFLGKQRSPEWHRVRAGRLTASNADSALGITSEKYRDRYIARIGRPDGETRFVTPAMRHGNDYEDMVKQWYSKSRGVEVQDVGFVYPLDPRFSRLGASPDGLVGDEGMTEIKCPYNGIYPSLLERRALLATNPAAIREGDYSHIMPSHYLQMQVGMGIMGRKWCDYIVADIPHSAAAIASADLASKRKTGSRSPSPPPACGGYTPGVFPAVNADGPVFISPWRGLEEVEANPIVVSDIPPKSEVAVTLPPVVAQDAVDYYVERIYFDYQYWISNRANMALFTDMHLATIPVETIDGVFTGRLQDLVMGEEEFLASIEASRKAGLTDNTSGQGGPAGMSQD